MYRRYTKDYTLSVGIHKVTLAHSNIHCLTELHSLLFSLVDRETLSKLINYRLIGFLNIMLLS